MFVAIICLQALLVLRLLVIALMSALLPVMVVPIILLRAFIMPLPVVISLLLVLFPLLLTFAAQNFIIIQYELLRQNSRVDKDGFYRIG
jgi:hypothetical protein